MVELKKTRPAVGFLALSLGLGVGGCSSNGDASAADGGSSSGDAGMVGCATDPRVEALAVNLTHQGENLKNHMPGLTFVLTKADYIPPAAQLNTWTLKILDASGQPVKGAKLTFPIPAGRMSDPWMPEHSHGDPAIPIPTDNHDGTYTVSNLYLYMGGIWSLKIAAQSGSTADNTTFTVCVGE